MKHIKTQRKIDAHICKTVELFYKLPIDNILIRDQLRTNDIDKARLQDAVDSVFVQENAELILETLELFFTKKLLIPSTIWD